MAEEKKLFFLKIFPKCPYFKNALNQLFLIAIIILGTLGVHYLNVWVAGAYLTYAILWNYFIMLKYHCQHCYYKTKESTEEEKLLPKDKWVETCLQKHVDCANRFKFNIFILWFLPIILMIISFFFNFSIYTVITLICFIITLVVNGIHMRYKVCPTCAIIEECHNAFTPR